MKGLDNFINSRRFVGSGELEGEQPELTPQSFPTRQEKRLQKAGYQTGTPKHQPQTDGGKFAQRLLDSSNYRDSPVHDWNQDPRRIIHGGLKPTKENEPESTLIRELRNNPYLKDRRETLHDEVDKVGKRVEEIRNLPEPDSEADESKWEAWEELQRRANLDESDAADDPFSEDDEFGIIMPGRHPFPIDRNNHVDDLFRDYTYGGFSDVNDFLRYGELPGSGRFTEEDEDRAMRLMVHHMLKKFYTGNEGYQYGRAVSERQYDNLMKLKPGDLIRDPGFLSVTRADHNPLDSGGMTRINTPGGVSHYDIDPRRHSLIKHAGYEQETMLAPNTMLQFTGIENDEPQFDAYTPHNLKREAWQQLLKGRVLSYGNNNLDHWEDAMDPDKFEELQDNLYESKKPKRRSPFGNRMDDFEFEVIYSPSGRTFDKFTQNK